VSSGRQLAEQLELIRLRWDNPEGRCYGSEKELRLWSMSRFMQYQKQRKKTTDSPLIS
jgi:hypothetical protein